MAFSGVFRYNSNIMTYIYRVIQEGPSGLWSMDAQPLSDSSGYGRNATFTGTPKTTRPIVAKGIAAQLLDSGDAISYPIDKIMMAGREENSFTLEAWVKPTYGNTEILTRDNSGLFIDGLILRFTIDMGPGYSVEYKNLIPGDIYHVVAVYDHAGIYLFVNGVKVAGLDIDQGDSFVDTTATLSSNTSSSVVIDSVATYQYVLPSSVITDHYILGTSYPGVTDLSKNNGGNHYDFIDANADVYGKVSFPATPWSGGIYDSTLAIVDNQLVNTYSDTNLEYQSGTWTFNESFESNVDVTLTGSRISWLSSDPITVEKSEDGGSTWNALSNGGVITESVGLASGYSVSIRVTVPNSTEQISVEYLSLTFYSSMNIRGADEDLVATMMNPQNTILSEEHVPAASFNDNAGVRFVSPGGGLSIPEDDSFGGYFAVEMTVKVDSSAASATVLWVDTASAQPQITTDASGNWTFSNLDALYIDGAAISSGAALAPGEWHHVLATFPESLAALYIGNNPAGTAGYPVQIGHLATYSDAVTSADATAIYNAWVGAPSAKVTDPGTMTVSENSAGGTSGAMMLTTSGSSSSTGSSLSMYPSAILKTNPYAYLPLDEAAGAPRPIDRGSGMASSDYVRTTNGQPSLVPYGDGHSVYFQGDSYIDYHGSIGNIYEFSASCVIQTTSSAEQAGVGRLSSIAAAHCFMLGAESGYAKLQTWGGNGILIYGPTISDGKPHVLTMTYSGPGNTTGTGKLFVDGVLVATGTTSSLQVTQPSMRFGYNATGGNRGVVGNLDELIFWQRTLTDQEVYDLWKAYNMERRPAFKGYSRDWAIVSGG